MVQTEKLASTAPSDISRELYEELFPAVAHFVGKMGGTFDDAKDLFHDALIIYHEQQGRTQIHATPQAYILGTVKNLWFRKYKNTRLLADFDALDQIAEPLDLNTEPIVAKLYALIENSGKTCLDLLKAFYYERWSLSRIADSMGYSSVHSATVQKYKCLEKVKGKVKEKSLNYEDFFGRAESN